MTKWEIDRFLKLTQDQLAKNFVRAGVFFASKQREFLNRDQQYKRGPGGRHRGLSPSQPGEFPKKLSGQLQRSITWSFDRKKMALTVGSNLKPYPSLLQTGTRFMRPRPWLSMGFEKVRDQLGRIVLGK